jgi:hypothetical protein
MIKNRIGNLFNLFKNIIISPQEVFENIKEEQIQFEVYLIFFLSAIVTFLKTFKLEGQRINFFETKDTNEILAFLSIPIIKWVSVYIIFFFFILLIYWLSNFFLGKVKFKHLMLCLMSVSGLGLILQAVFFVFHYILTTKTEFILSYIAFSWVAAVSFFATRYIIAASFFKSILIFIISALPILFMTGLAGISPYLAWLTL